MNNFHNQIQQATTEQAVATLCAQAGIDYNQMYQMVAQQQQGMVINQIQQRQMEDMLNRHYGGMSGLIFGKIGRFIQGKMTPLVSPMNQMMYQAPMQQAPVMVFNTSQPQQPAHPGFSVPPVDMVKPQASAQPVNQDANGTWAPEAPSEIEILKQRMDKMEAEVSGIKTDVHNGFNTMSAQMTQIMQSLNNQATK